MMLESVAKAISMAFILSSFMVSPLLKMSWSNSHSINIGETAYRSVTSELPASTAGMK